MHSLLSFPPIMLTFPMKEKNDTINTIDMSVRLLEGLVNSTVFVTEKAFATSTKIIVDHHDNDFKKRVGS